MSDPFWQRFHDNEKTILVYMSRGGKGSNVPWTKTEITDAQQKIRKYNKNIEFATSPHDVEFIVIPDGAKLLSDPKTHAITKQLSDFYKMLKHGKVHSSQKPLVFHTQIKKPSNKKPSHKKPSAKVPSAQNVQESNTPFWSLFQKPAQDAVPSIAVSERNKTILSFLQKTAQDEEDASPSLGNTLVPRRKPPKPQEHKESVPEHNKPMLSFLQKTAQDEEDAYPPPSPVAKTLIPRRKPPKPQEYKESSVMQDKATTVKSNSTATFPPTKSQDRKESFVIQDKTKVDTEQKPPIAKSATAFPCAEVLELFMTQFPGAMIPPLEEIERRVRTMFMGAGNALTARIALVVQRKLINQAKDANKPKREKQESAEDKELRLKLAKRREEQKVTEDLFDAHFNATMEKFNEDFKEIEPTDEDYDEVLDFLEYDFARMLQEVEHAPSSTYLRGLAEELWSMRMGYSKFEVGQAIRALVDEWLAVFRYAAAFNKYKKRELPPELDQLYDQLSNQINDAYENLDISTIDELFALLTKIVKNAQQEKGKTVIHPVTYANQDLVKQIMENFMFERKAVKEAVAMMWK